MKKIFILSLFQLLAISLTNAQNVSFTIKPGSTSTSAKVYMTSNADITGVVSQIVVTFVLPASVNATAPTASFVTNSAYPQWGNLSLNTPTTEPVNSVSSYVYTFYNVPVTSTTTSFTNGTEVLIGEVTFATGTDLTNLLLASLPNGGTSTFSFLIIEVGTVISNFNSLTYGAGAVNSGSSSGLSYVPLNAVLPVKFISFYALKSGDAGKLTWTVNDDANNKYFDVERSIDGRSYKTFTTVDALGNGQAINTYTAIDPVLSKQGVKNIYYRIKQVDRNGTSIYSLIRILNVDSDVPLSLYPNPARNITKLILDAPEPGKASVILRDAAGRQLQLINMELVKGINQKDINVSALPSGEYNVSVVSTSLNQTIKLSKIN